MTTRVTIEPAGHRIEVTLSEDNYEQRQILEIGAAPVTFWIFGKRELHAKEVAPEPAS